MRIGVLGAGGLMGGAFARRLKAEGFEVHVYNRTVSKMQELLDQGGYVLAESPQDLCAGVDVVLGILADDRAFGQVFADPAVHTSLPGTLLVQMATLSPRMSRQLGEILQEHGGDYLEAPVLGSLPQIREGSLQIFHSGGPQAVDRALPVLQSLGTKIVAVSEEWGKAAALKLAMNQLIPSLTASFSLSYGLCEKEGVDLDLFMDILGDSSLACPQFTKKLPMMRARDFSNPNFNSRNMLKDVTLILQAAEECGLHTAQLRGVQEIYEEVLTNGDGDMDYSSVFNTVNPLHASSKKKGGDGAD